MPLRLMLIIGLVFAAGPARAQFYGPFDYTNPEHYAKYLPVVEDYHFNSAVENLTGTMPGGTIGAHLAYVLRHFPNHHRALNSMARYWRQFTRRGQLPPDQPTDRTPEYWFERAIEFAPHDPMPKALLAKHLLETGKRDRARDLLREASAQADGSRNAELHYSLGLFFLQADMPDDARRHAEAAYSLNFPLPGLRDKLIAAGAWRTPTGAP